MCAKFNLEMLEMGTADVKHILSTMVKSGGHPQPVCLCSTPGVGKSQLVQQVCAECGVNYEKKNYHEIRAALVVDSSDLTGLPVINKKSIIVNGVTCEFDQTTKYSLPDLLPIKKEGMSEEELKEIHVIFFDEINRSSDPAIMNAIFQVVTDWRVGPHQLLDNVVILLALNPEADGYLVNTMDPALINRINFLFMKCSYKEWRAYAISKGFNRGVIEFLDVKKELLAHSGILKNENQDRRFPSPRAWENVHKAIKLFNLDLTSTVALECDFQFKLIAGIVGQEAASEFLSFMHTEFDKLPIPGEKILEEYLTNHSLQARITDKTPTGGRVYDTASLQITIEGINASVLIQKEKLSIRTLANLLAFLCDIPVEQSVSVQNFLSAGVSQQFTLWLFTTIAKHTELDQLWKTLQKTCLQYSTGQKASQV